ncbi:MULTISPECIES: hypothetical protein [Asticcacaulis]|uniref:hypothetical protein n=1 Tax=Asticcacaulis TaxID=76890 RepID=UPI001AE58782|nr:MULTISPECIES: hypothetical protein [Asticcacaulis]MBP2159100.1 hypothetical protein [Asticcacaulis solisilvae]MDR6800145.1 hypothetical protein [Asticcacaulis sp. BE141]
MPTSSQKISQGPARETTKSGRRASPATALLDNAATKGVPSLKGKSRAAKIKEKVEALKGQPLRGFTRKRYSLAIAKKIADAVKLAAEAGQPTRIVLDIDAAGMTSLIPEPVHVNAPAVEEVGELSPELQQALSAARERGRVRVAEILAGAEMLNAEAFSEMLGTTRVTVNTWRQENKVLGLDGAKRGFRFPEWQVGADGKPYAVLPQLHDLLGGPWGVYRFMVQVHGALDGLTGREALQRGLTEKVLAAADGDGRDFS